MDRHTSLLVIHTISSALPIPLSSKSSSTKVFLCPPLFCTSCFGCNRTNCLVGSSGDVCYSGLQTSSFSVVSFLRIVGDFHTVRCLIYDLSSSPGGQCAAFKCTIDTLCQFSGQCPCLTAVDLNRLHCSQEQLLFQITT